MESLMPPLLSIIVPHHNHLRRLPRLLDSILAQSFKDMEVVLVDDCSDEPCRPIVEAYRGKGLDIVLLEHNERIYTMRARLAGIKAAKGKIIGFADADDVLWGTEAVEKNVDIFLEEKPDILHFRTARIDAGGNFLDWFLPMDPPVQRLEGSAVFHAYVSSPYFQQLSTVWNKYFSKDLATAVCCALENSRVLRYVEDSCISMTAAFHAAKYIGSFHAGYGYTYDFSDEPQKYAESHERAVYVWHMLHELPLWFEQRGCPEADVRALKKVLTEYLCIKVGHASMAAVEQDGLFVSSATVERLLQHTDAHTFIKVLLLGASVNAQKILHCVQTLLPKVDKDEA
jgi:glycosyltransferase involved in cell wall biosynthesis